MTTSPLASEAPRSIISIVVPAYNEEAGIEQFHSRLLSPALENTTDCTFEIVYVNDGSTDRTLELLAGIADRDQRVRVVNLSRNFGKEIATTAGISETHGDATVIMDADGQHPPALIGAFIDMWRNGAQVVVGVRRSNQKEGMVKKLGSAIFYRLLNAMSDMQTVPRSTDFRLIDRQVRDEFLKMPERNRITRGLIDWLGFQRDYVEFDAPPRLAGAASYTVSKLTRLALNSFTTLSLRPLFFFGYIGLFITLAAIVVGLFVFTEQILLGDPLGLNFSGSAMLSIFVSFLVGIVLMSQGIMALYLSHIHTQTQLRPLFVIDASRSINLDKRQR